MRIIGGKYRGRRLTGKAPDGVRPTTDMARESVFNILENLLDFEGIKVLDLFAGTGALGFEALSRGAETCVFVEKNRRTSATISQNADTLGLTKNDFQVINADAAKAVTSIINANGLAPFGLAFLDPPYQQGINNRIIELLAANSILSQEGIIVSEQSSLQSLLLPAGIELLKEKVFGETRVSIMRVI